MTKFRSGGRAAAALALVLSVAPAVAGPHGRIAAQVDDFRRPPAALKVNPGRSGYDAMIARHAQAHGVPVDLAHAVISYESKYRADAVGNSGEIGLMQIMPATARGMGFSGDAAALHDPETNLRFGMKYLGQAWRLGGGDVCEAILRYNAGLGATRMTPHASKYCAVVKRTLATP